MAIDNVGGKRRMLKIPIVVRVHLADEGEWIVYTGNWHHITFLGNGYWVWEMGA